MKKMIKKLSAVVLATALTVTMFVTGQEAKATSHDFRNAYGRTVYTVGCTNDGGSVMTSVSAFSTKHQTYASASGTLYYYNKNKCHSLVNNIISFYYNFYCYSFLSYLIRNIIIPFYSLINTLCFMLI